MILMFYCECFSSFVVNDFYSYEIEKEKFYFSLNERQWKINTLSIIECGYDFMNNMKDVYKDDYLSMV